MSELKIPVLDLKPQYQSLKPEIQAAIDRVLESGQFILGEDVRLFEQEVAEELGAKHAIAVHSGTDALIISLRALGIGPGDQVITTPFSFFATAESISNVGATPVFADVELTTCNIDPAAIKALITPRTKAIMPVHLYGQPAAMAQIIEIAAEFDLKVIEDCAQSFGARYFGLCSTCQRQCQDSTRSRLSGKSTGTIGDMGAFSFFPSKNLGAYGDGGMIITDNDALAEAAQMLRVHGEKRRYHNLMLGYNSRLDTLQAAILRVKLPHIHTWSLARRQVALTYNRLLADLESVITPAVTEGHVFHQYTIRITNGQRDRVQQSLAAQGIATMVYYPIPQDQLPVYQGKYPVYPVSQQLAKEVLSLPIWPEIATTTLEQVAQSIRAALLDVELLA
ncbi:MAG: DegT/DnrJ/EryC1/StrS family aminotransferase [Aphanocapsa sp. GSE-SYN-MK-11-07L]|nr:DegT/DnrJ/EryC1/StrS family aminotransferase [Aphanocapsa sp. GSE-SYN-MK-11-07L]